MLDERLPTDMEEHSLQDAQQLARLLHGHFYAHPLINRSPSSIVRIERAELKAQLLAVADTKRAQLEAARAQREAAEEAARAALANRVSLLRARCRRLQALAQDAKAPSGEWPALEGGSSKLSALAALLRAEVLSQPDGKAIVFTKFPEAVPLVGAFLEGQGIGAISLREGGKRWWQPRYRTLVATASPSKGGGSASNAAAAATEEAAPPVEIFRRDGACAVLLLEANASAAGLTLTCAQHVIFLDVLGSDLLELQAKARVARIGQTKPTTAWHLIAKGSAEELLRDAADGGSLPAVVGDGSSNGALVALLKKAEERAGGGSGA